MAVASPVAFRNTPRRGRLLLAIIVLLVIALIVWSLWPRPMEVDAAPVVRGELRAWVEEQAMTRVPHIHRITMPMDGRIHPITLREGERVSPGQTVAMLETDDLRSALAAAEAQLAAVTARLAEAQDARLERTALEQVNEVLVSIDRTVDAAEQRTRAGHARREFTADQRRRGEELFERGAMTETELERRRLEAVEAEVSYATDVLTLRAAMATRAAARIAPRFIQEVIDLRTYTQQVLQQEQQAAREEVERLQRDLDRAAITAPVGGTVFTRAVADAMPLPAGTVLLEIGRLEDLEVEAEVLSEEVVRITQGSPAEVFGGAVGELPLSATVARIFPQGFRTVSALGIEQQRVLVILEFAPGELAQLAERRRKLGADYRVRVRILADHREDALQIPRTAIFRGPGGRWQTFAIEAGRAQLTTVEVGLMTPRYAEILSGLVEGQQVILSPPGELAPGMRIRPIQR